MRRITLYIPTLTMKMTTPIARVLQALRPHSMAQLLGLATLLSVLHRSSVVQTLRAEYLRIIAWSTAQVRALLASPAADAVRTSQAVAVIRENLDLVAHHTGRLVEMVRMHHITRTLRARPLAQGVLVAGLVLGGGGAAVAAPELAVKPVSAIEHQQRLAGVAEVAAEATAAADAVREAAKAANIPTDDLDAATAQLDDVLTSHGLVSEPSELEIELRAAAAQPADEATDEAADQPSGPQPPVADQQTPFMQVVAAKAQSTVDQAAGEPVGDLAATTAATSLKAPSVEPTTIGPLVTDRSAGTALTDVLTTSANTQASDVAADLHEALDQVTDLTEKVSAAAGVGSASTAVLAQPPAVPEPTEEQIAAAAKAVAERAAAEQAAAEQAAAEQAAAQAAAEAAAKAEAEAAARQAKDDASRAAADHATHRAVTEGNPGGGNGQFSEASLCELSFAPGARLRCDAAAAVESMNIEFRHAFGVDLSITDSYRSYDAQVRTKAQLGRLAATPGTSNHGWAKALDLGGGIQSFSSPQYQWMKANAGRFGWVHPGWAEPGGSKPEPWHWEFGR
ncbi:M15 family metallopeptidase [Cellulomonas chengniuliangii]|uniref:M15 family metallopeptidase n=1 Tax=Cellulomonas chengniuliangii TaxID=2968084 RepID=A0ABY5L1T0_9CELL|nr:M15 family metallopeptidase [Cellulomonas chengniuliangii]MCC2307400.1 M15 family metallopeptidase [Cellulomonas chengniuliangii]UUI75819.1 M15 family metallopeptidase [Cellulomonas chengniuliangii]